MGTQPLESSDKADGEHHCAFQQVVYFLWCSWIINAVAVLSIYILLKCAATMIFVSLGGFRLQFPEHRMFFVFWMGPIAGPGRERRNIFPLFPLEQPDWYAARSLLLSPTLHGRDWEQSCCSPCVPDPASPKEQRLQLHASSMSWVSLSWSSMNFWCSGESFYFKEQLSSTVGSFPAHWLLHSSQRRKEHRIHLKY